MPLELFLILSSFPLKMLSSIQLGMKRQSFSAYLFMMSLQRLILSWLLCLQSVQCIIQGTPARRIQPNPYPTKDHGVKIQENASHYPKELSLEVSHILNNLFQAYDTRLRPNFGGPPVLVNVTVLLENLGPISEVAMNFRLDMAIRQKWNDPRLTFTPLPNGRTKELSLNYEFSKRIWVPDIFFPESIQAFKHDVMQPNTLVRLYPNGDILMSSRVTVISKCPMDLSFFPMDLQSCSLLIESYGYTVDDVILHWSHGKTTESTEFFEIAQFYLLNISTSELRLEFSTGIFSDLKMVFLLKRSLTHFILQLYLPSTMVVMLSWISFWVSRDSVPARAALSITTVLTMITLIGTTNSSLPRVSNVKALDVHFAICLLFVFGALVEFAAVCYFNKARFNNRGLAADYEEQLSHILQDLIRKGKRNSSENGHSSPNSPVAAGASGSRHPMSLLSMHVHSRPFPQHPPKVDISSIDIHCRILFPSAYALITLAYWIIYTNALYEKFRWTQFASAAV